jgi:ferredoxin
MQPPAYLPIDYYPVGCSSSQSGHKIIDCDLKQYGQLLQYENLWSSLSRAGVWHCLIDEELCTGCKDCIEACPLGVMQFDEEKGLAGKCDLYVERINRGLQPACVAACPSCCIYFGDISRITEQLGK